MPSQDTTPKAQPVSAEPAQLSQAAAWATASPVGVGRMAAGITPPAQAKAIHGIQSSPRVAAQRKLLQAMFGPRHAPMDTPVQLAEDEPPIRNAYPIDEDDGQYVLIELTGERVPHASEVAYLLDSYGLVEKRDKESDPFDMEDFREAVLKARATARWGDSRSTNAKLRGLKNARVEVKVPGEETTADIIIGPYPRGTVEDPGDFNEADLVFSDNAAASGDHSAITDNRAGGGGS
ncbi:MAG: hypothetical protein V4864_04040 [Pseudomonadota bacterium]